jgi:undecaprenyl-diphosphatase
LSEWKDRYLSLDPGHDAGVAAIRLNGKGGVVEEVHLGIELKARLQWLQSSNRRNDLLKGGVVVIFYSWAWFRRHAEIVKQRQIVICGLIAGIAAPWFARWVPFVAPFRVRPLHNPALHWQLAYETSPSTLINWSSFPSDHAAMFAAFAMALCFVSRRAGIIFFAHVFAFVDFARIYLGLHYLTDILAGTLIGIAVSYLSLSKPLQTLVVEHVMPALDRNPQYF